MRQRKAKLEGYVQTLAAMDELIDFSEMAGAITLQCAAYNARRLVWLLKRTGASAKPA